MNLLPFNIAHRGDSGNYPENTLLAFQKAVAAGANWLELDVVTTRDDVVVVSHDVQVDRCTNGSGRISEMDLAQVKQLDAGIWFGDSFAGQRIPTLDEVLDFATGQPIRLCIEVKGHTTPDYVRNARAMLNVLQPRDWLQRVTVTSFNADCLRELRQWEPLLASGLDPDKQDGTYTPWQLCQHVLDSHANFLLHRHEALTPEIVDEAHQHGFALWTWTVDTADDMRRVISMGVDGIMTNCPGILTAVLEQQ